MLGKKKRKRKPHPDPRVESNLQYILSLYASIERTQQRIDRITGSQSNNESWIRQQAGYHNVSDLHQQAQELRDERLVLEAFIRAQHEEIVKRLVDLGDDALYLGAV